MDNDRCSYDIDASDSDRLVAVLRQGGGIVSRRRLDLNLGAVAALTGMIRKSQGKPVICINSTGEVAFSGADSNPAARQACRTLAMKQHVGWLDC